MAWVLGRGAPGEASMRTPERVRYGRRVGSESRGINRMGTCGSGRCIVRSRGAALQVQKEAHGQHFLFRSEGYLHFRQPPLPRMPFESWEVAHFEGTTDGTRLPLDLSLPSLHLPASYCPTQPRPLTVDFAGDPSPGSRDTP